MAKVILGVGQYAKGNGDNRILKVRPHVMFFDSVETIELDRGMGANPYL
jgi:hypothetical protein